MCVCVCVTLTVFRFDYDEGSVDQDGVGEVEGSLTAGDVHKPHETHPTRETQGRTTVGEVILIRAHLVYLGNAACSALIVSILSPSLPLNWFYPRHRYTDTQELGCRWTDLPG